MADDPNVLDQLRHDLSDGLLAKKEEAIRTALGPLTDDEIQNRVSVIRFPDGREQYVLDGVPVVEFTPPVFETRKGMDHTMNLVGTIQVRPL